MHPQQSALTKHRWSGGAPPTPAPMLHNARCECNYVRRVAQPQWRRNSDSTMRQVDKARLPIFAAAFPRKHYPRILTPERLPLESATREAHSISMPRSRAQRTTTWPPQVEHARQPSPLRATRQQFLHHASHRTKRCATHLAARARPQRSVVLAWVHPHRPAINEEALSNGPSPTSCGASPTLASPLSSCSARPASPRRTTGRPPRPLVPSIHSPGCCSLGAHSM